MAGDKHNDSLEQFFREKTNEFDISFNETDWEDMEQRLDQAEKVALLSRQNRLMRMRFAAVAVFLIILAGLGVIIYQNYNRINELESQISQQKTEQNGEDIFTNKNAETDESLLAGENEENQMDERINPDRNSSGNDEFLAIQEDQVSSTQSNPPASNSLVNKLQNNALEMNRLWASGIEIEMVKQYERANLKMVVKPTDPVGLKLPSTQDNRPVIAAAMGGDYQASTSPNIGETYSSFSSLSFGVTVGPDLSTAGSLNNFYTPGFKIGATIEYSLNKRFGISTGIIYSKVNYTASGSEYNPPEGFWTYGEIPLKTEAACAILAIPLRFKFNFAQLSDSRFYMTAGVASYIMLNETYQFNYAQEDESQLVQSWSDRTGTRHWLSNATLSIGYEFDVSKTMSLSFEPYLNIPIRSVGWGNIDLYSTGTLISINYQFK